VLSVVAPLGGSAARWHRLCLEHAEQAAGEPAVRVPARIVRRSSTRRWAPRRGRTADELRSASSSACSIHSRAAPPSPSSSHATARRTASGRVLRSRVRRRRRRAEREWTRRKFPSLDARGQWSRLCVPVRVTPVVAVSTASHPLHPPGVARGHSVARHRRDSRTQIAATLGDVAAERLVIEVGSTADGNDESPRPAPGTPLARAALRRALRATPPGDAHSP
jgi:hypothetical protein